MLCRPFNCTRYPFTVCRPWGCPTRFFWTCNPKMFSGCMWVWSHGCFGPTRPIEMEPDFPVEEVGIEELTALREQLVAELADLDKAIEVIHAEMQPQTLDDVRAVEQKLTAAQKALDARKSELQKQK